ncbi:MAG: hypothetical protein AAGF54_08070 [Pseudomonadota bacterium]
MTNSSNDCKVTNKSGAEVVVMVPTTSDPNSTSSNTAVYNQNLEILATKEGGNIIRDGASGTITLNQTYPDPKTGKQEQSLLYDLLISTTSWYYPVANLSVMQDFFDTPPSYPDQTATAANQKSLSDAASFLQTTAAYPTSQLTKNYQAALSGAQTTAQSQANGGSGSANSVANSVTDSVNAFFKSTDSYQDVTLAAVVAVQSYYEKFPFVWGQYKTSAVTYYIYGNDGSTTTFQGSLVLTPPSTLDLTKVNGGYTIKFNPAKNPSDTTTVDVDISQAVDITYTNGLFVTDPDKDISQIAVKGNFMLKRNFTQVQTDTQILPVITGSVYGLTALGYDSPQKSNDKSSDFWDTLFHPKTSAQVFQSIMEIGGAIMMLHFFATSLWGIFKWVKGKISGSKNTEASVTEDDFKSQLEDIKTELSNKIDEAVKNITNDKESAPDNPEDAVDQITEETGNITDNMNAAQVQDGLEAQANTAETLEQYASEMTSEQLENLESIATDIKTANSNLQDAIDSQENLSDVVDTAQTSMNDIGTQNTDLSSDLGDKISAEEKESIEVNEAATTEASETVDNMKEAAKEDAENASPEAGDEIEPVE